MSKEKVKETERVDWLTKFKNNYKASMQAALLEKEGNRHCATCKCEVTK